MRLGLLSFFSLALAALAIQPAAASERYGQRPPIVVSPDLSSPWLLQLQRRPVGAQNHSRNHALQRQLPGARVVVAPPAPPARASAEPIARPTAQPRAESVQTAAVAAGAARQAPPSLDPRFLPQVVDYSGSHKPGTIVIDTNQNFQIGRAHV